MQVAQKKRFTSDYLVKLSKAQTLITVASSPTGWRILEFLTKNDGATIYQIAEHLGVHTPNAMVAVDKLRRQKILRSEFKRTAPKFSNEAKATYWINRPVFQKLSNAMKNFYNG